MGKTDHGVSAQVAACFTLHRRYGRGQGFVEYACIIMLVALAVVATVALLGPTLSPMFVHANSGL